MSVAKTSTEHIEIRQRHDTNHAYIIGTKFRVASIYNMHINDGLSVDEIVEHYGVLDHAKVHAALAYYYDNREQVEREWQEWNAEAEQWVEENDPMTLKKLRAEIEHRNKKP